jgi:hypothetical protein
MELWKNAEKLLLSVGKALWIAEAVLTVGAARDTEGRPNAVRPKKGK